MANNDKALELAAKFVASRSSLVAFRTLLLPESNDRAPAPMHYRWSELILRGKRNFAIEAARDTAKTQYALRSNLLHALVFPNEKRSYIVIIRATDKLAGALLKNISSEFQSRPEFFSQPDGDIRIFTDSGDALEVHYPNGMKVRIEAYGKGGSIRGISWGAKRPDLVVCDDLQSVKDMQSDTVCDTDWDWFLSDVKFLGTECRIFLIGNNLGEKCIIEQVITNAKEVGFDCERCPILDEDGNSTWPSRFPVSEILAEKENFARLGKADIWYREKLCISRSPDTQRFKPEMFKYFNPAEVSTRNMSVFMTVDLATSTAASSDYSVCCVVGVNDQGHWFVLDCWYGRVTPVDHMDHIFRMVSKWNPLWVGIEKVAYQSAMQSFLEKEMPRRNVMFTIKPLIAAAKKELRIDAMQTRFAVGSVWFPREAAWGPEMESQLLAFPTGKHDDLIDALAYVEQIALVPNKSRRRQNYRLPVAGKVY